VEEGPSDRAGRGPGRGFGGAGRAGHRRQAQATAKVIVPGGDFPTGGGAGRVKR